MVELTLSSPHDRIHFFSPWSEPATPSLPSTFSLPCASTLFLSHPTVPPPSSSYLPSPPPSSSLSPLFQPHHDSRQVSELFCFSRLYLSVASVTTPPPPAAEASPHHTCRFPLSCSATLQVEQSYNTKSWIPTFTHGPFPSFSFSPCPLRLPSRRGTRPGPAPSCPAPPRLVDNDAIVRLGRRGSCHLWPRRY